MKKINLFRKGIVAIAIGILVTVPVSAMASTTEVSISANWRSTHANAPYAPSNAGYVDHQTILHGRNGATVYCNSVSHSMSTAISGTVTVRCETFAMPQKTITNTGVAMCSPNVGQPNHDIAVTYSFTAYTPYSGDTYNTSGSIIKK